ncbi:abnormal spindle-like microcephaly-associated protein homolog [Achroia grisella]|uniref:abnormal spindle-like microcephaly-associated protein homolog n=1 Tax=Achroia grisella TaxID=688607 RepID=UPI0027D3059C|nr:abnormal spindle-like microcephaly-associated protein homolog [Achroia grisella]
MYFEIENTPEHIKRSRRLQAVQKNSPKEECPRLVLAPFSRPPQVVFENVLVGTTCERNLEVFNPSKHVQQITLGRSLPPGLIIALPEEWLVLEPESCYYLTMLWTPMQPTALRETIRFTNENRGRYDVVIVLKSRMQVKEKSSKSKVFKISPNKMKKKGSKKSPVSIYKKKSEIIYNTTKIKKSVNVIQSKQHRVLQPSNKDNVSMYNDYSIESHQVKCPFDYPDNINFTFDTSEVFSNMRKPKSDFLQQVYDQPYTTNTNRQVQKQNIKLSKKQHNTLDTDVFDNLTFTPLKSFPATNDKLEKGPQIILSMNSESDSSLDMKTSNKENETHSIISIVSTQSNKWMTVNHHTQVENQYAETPTLINKKIPNTSSPKEFNSPNFTINTEFSRISDLSFYPQRFSTERKGLPTVNNEIHDLVDDMNSNIKVSSDTYTKESPNTPMDPHNIHTENRHPYFFLRDQPKMCRQALFKEYQQQKDAYDRNYLHPVESNIWHKDYRSEMKSPPRSLTPPLQSIPEESTQFSEMQVFDKSDKQTSTFTINDRTFEKTRASINNRQSWSKKAVIKAEPDIWKIPVSVPKKSLKPKSSLRGKESLGTSIYNVTYEGNSTKTNHNLSMNRIGNVYSQSSTVDPFLSSTYFYDEEAVDKFEKEFKRWLNCILTPPADLDSNVEQKIDVGKAWIENRNREVPAAPTKEQVCSKYHNSHRLESLRRAARALLMSTEMTLVFQKLTAQIEKKLIAIRTDRNLHLDVGLQKIIMELLLSYNPLWLRIGLEAIYGIVLPLKSNSDIEGLTTFIIQRLFKNPHLKNKHSKSNAPNMLLPAYMEAIKKFTLKKFFMLVFFLDQAKQRKLISHDPCLFCRNAVCKESREIIIRFTRELIAGIGDITKHLRPLGYVVSHKQSYLDEYKYAVHNIALDIRDGVRLTKVMEIILIKNGLLNQLRTPAISRLQKIHNVQVALNALKEANFVIHGDIAANDIADGHREKTLSLLWQIIHEFRAPLFEKAANVIQTWWRKKFEVIMEKRKEEEKRLQQKNYAACVIQCWWRRIQYNRLVEWKMHQVTTATITIQKYCRMWLSRTRLRKIKTSVLIIENWYRSKTMIKEAKVILLKLKQEKQEQILGSTIIIQSYVRRWICMKQYKLKIQKTIFIQSFVRSYLTRKQYLLVRKAVIYTQQKYRGKRLMRIEMKILAEKRRSAIAIQSFYRMIRDYRVYQKLKKAVSIVEEHYIALLKMRNERSNYLKQKKCAIILQTYYHAFKIRKEYLRQRNIIVRLQRKVKANQLMKKEKNNYLNTRKATVVLQKYIKSYLVMKKTRDDYLAQRKSVILIQTYFRTYLVGTLQRKNYLQLRSATVSIQNFFRSFQKMRKERAAFLKLKHSAVYIQRRYRAQALMKQCKEYYDNLRATIITVQLKFRAQRLMKKERLYYLRLKSSCLIIQNAYRAYALGKCQRQDFVNKKQAAILIQRWYRNIKKCRHVMDEYHQTKQACVTIQRVYRAYVIARIQRREYIKIKTATICIQKYYRAYIEMKTVRQEYIQLKASTVTIQRFYRSYVDTKRHRELFLRTKISALLIQNYYKRFKESKVTRQTYCDLRNATIFIQRKYRSICATKIQRDHFLKLKNAALVVQQKYRALQAMKQTRLAYLKLRSAAVILQTRYRARLCMIQENSKYVSKVKACIYIQRFYRAYMLCKKHRKDYLELKNSTFILQHRYRALLAMRKERQSYVKTRLAVITLQRKYRARHLMLQEKSKFIRMLQACVIIQKTYRSYLLGKRQRLEYMRLKCATITIQKWFRATWETRCIRTRYLQLKKIVIFTQRLYRAKKHSRESRRLVAAKKIQTWFRCKQIQNTCRNNYLNFKRNCITVQSIIRMYIQRKRYFKLKCAILSIQKYYRAHILAVTSRRHYLQIRKSVIKLQAWFKGYKTRKCYLNMRRAALVIQTAYRSKKQREQIKAHRERAAICLQKYFRRYLVQSRYRKYREKVIYIQRIWRGKLVTRLMHCDFFQKRQVIIKLQSVIRGYLVRKQVQFKKEHVLQLKEENRKNWAASKIQALFRGHRTRVIIAGNRRVADLRRRWQEGALNSDQPTLKERNEDAMDVLRNMSDIETVIRAFRSLELLTEVFPMMYNKNASSIVHRVYIYMSVTNRSISSIEVLKCAASVLVNLTRYKITGPKIYSRIRIPPILKFMWRFSNSETYLFCILSTYLWLFSKYDDVREDLIEFLHIPEYYKMLLTIKGNIDRMKRMASNTTRSKYSTPQTAKFVSHTGNQSLNYSLCSNHNSARIPLPALEPDYGIIRADKPRYFEDAGQAITCLFSTYKL